MQAPPQPADDADRVAALHALNVLDTPPEQRFNRITRTAARIFSVPIVLVSLVDTDRQWFKSRYGLVMPETPRRISFCAHAILQDSAMVIEDTLADPRFADNPMVTGAPNIRFYAGRPLLGPDGAKLGTLCLIDRKPREFGSHDRLTLGDLAEWVERELNIDREQAGAQARFDSVMDAVSEAAVVVDADGKVDTMNHAASSLFDCDPQEVVGQSIDLLLPGLTAAAQGNLLGQAEQGVTHRDIDSTALRKNGSRFAVKVRASDFYARGRRMFTLAVRPA